MYPDWPEPNADLVPLPKCDGPKLESFNFRGPQKIKFVERLREGLHAHVFKVEILGHIDALKLFRFSYDHDWLGPAPDTDPDDRELTTTFYEFSEPFSRECRAFGRLQKIGYEELAVRCFGYLLLDEEHERIMMTLFSNLELDFNRNIEQDGKVPPIRGMVKEIGRVDETSFQTQLIRKILRDVIKLQQLGIVRIDVAARQIIGDKLGDFSTAITTPHSLTTPELNPHLTPEMITALELETFKLSLSDYL